MVSFVERTTGLNRLIRGEISAVETYRQALDKMKDRPEAAELHALLVDHRGAIQLLREHVLQYGATPPTSSGAWGTWAKFLEGTAQLLGRTAALDVLKEGEELGINEYERFLEEEEGESDCKDLVQMHLLPQARTHVATLNRLLSHQESQQTSVN